MRNILPLLLGGVIGLLSSDVALLAADPPPPIQRAANLIRKSSPAAEVKPIQSKNIHLTDWKIEAPLDGYSFFCATVGQSLIMPIRKFAAVDAKGQVLYPFTADELKKILTSYDKSGWSDEDYLKAAILYVHLTRIANEDGWVVLHKPKDFLDIKFNMPTKGPAVEARLQAAKKIKAPEVSKPKSGQPKTLVSFYAWHLIGGQLKQWEVAFSKDTGVVARQTDLGQFGGGGYD